MIKSRVFTFKETVRQTGGRSGGVTDMSFPSKEIERQTRTVGRDLKAVSESET